MGMMQFERDPCNVNCRLIVVILCYNFPRVRTNQSETTRIRLALRHRDESFRLESRTLPREVKS